MTASANITERGSDGIAFEKPIPASQPGDTFPAGAILLWGGSAAPTGWLICDGSQVGRAAYPTLYANYGVTWGGGDGSTTFNLPDFRDRVPVGKSGTKALGFTGGAATHSITISEMPSHDHGALTGTDNVTHTHGGVLTDSGLRMSTNTTGSGWVIPNTGVNSGGESVQHVHGIAAQGGGAAISLLQPYAAINYIVRAY